MRLLASLLLLPLFFVACSSSCDKTSSKEEIPPVGMAGTQHPGSISMDHPPVPNTPDQKALAEAQKNRRVLKGKVVEAIYKEGFAYVRLEMGDNASTWVAIVNQKPAVGENISVQEQVVLTDFHSKSLDRTFAKIVFGSIVE